MVCPIHWALSSLTLWLSTPVDHTISAFLKWGSEREVGLMPKTAIVCNGLTSVLCILNGTSCVWSLGEVRNSQFIFCVLQFQWRTLVPQPCFWLSLSIITVPLPRSHFQMSHSLITTTYFFQVTPSNILIAIILQPHFSLIPDYHLFIVHYPVMASLFTRLRFHGYRINNSLEYFLTSFLISLVLLAKTQFWLNPTFYLFITCPCKQLNSADRLAVCLRPQTSSGPSVLPSNHHMLP